MEKPQLLLMQIMAIEMIETYRYRYISIYIYYIYICIYIYRERERDYQRGPKLLAELLKPAEAPISRPRSPNILSDR
jgi:hypothetical protein